MCQQPSTLSEIISVVLLRRTRKPALPISTMPNTQALETHGLEKPIVRQYSRPTTTEIQHIGKMVPAYSPTTSDQTAILNLGTKRKKRSRKPGHMVEKVASKSQWSKSRRAHLSDP